MNKLLLIAAMFATAANAAVSPAPANTDVVEYTDKGSIVAIVCKERGDVRHSIKLAAAENIPAFKKFVGERMDGKHCQFLNSDAPIDVLAHEPVFTVNGPLWAIRFRQKDLYGKYVYWWASANYFPVSYPKTESWELELIDTKQAAE